MSLENQILQADFDAVRYLGKWYEIAKLPTPFQQQCARSVATYKLVEERDQTYNNQSRSRSKKHDKSYSKRHGKHRRNNSCSSSSDSNMTSYEAFISVYNQCFNNNGVEIESITGTANAYNHDLPAALTVSFPGFPADSGQGANYLVHKTDYVSYSIVGSPDKDSLFILSRTPTISVDEYDQLKEEVCKLGYNPDNLILDMDALTNPCPCSESESRSSSRHSSHSDCNTSTDSDPSSSSDSDSSEHNNTSSSTFLWLLLLLILIALIVVIVFPVKPFRY